MAFRKADRGGGLAQKIVLLDEPVVVEIPPFRAVEHVIEAGAGCVSGLVRSASEGLSDKTRLWMTPFDCGDQPPPESVGHLVGGVATEPFHAQSQQMFDHGQAVLVQTFRIAGVRMVELREITPDDLLIVVLAPSIGDAAIVPAHKPFGMLASERRIYGTVIEHQVEHDFQAGGTGLAHHLAGLVIRRSLAARIQQRGVDLEIIRN